MLKKNADSLYNERYFMSQTNGWMLEGFDYMITLAQVSAISQLYYEEYSRERGGRE